MNQQTIATTMTPSIFIDSIGGDLQVKGWDRPEVNIKANPEELTLQHDLDSIHLSCTASVALRVPEGASLHIGNVGGEARLKLLEEALEINLVGGSLVMRNVSGVKVSAVHGGLIAKNMAGDLTIGQVSGSAIVRNVEGDCQITQVLGDLNVRNCEGDLSVETRGGARVRLSELNGDVNVKALGSLVCHLPEDSSASIQADAPEIRVHLLDEKRTTSAGSYSTNLEEGQHTVALQAHGSLVLQTWEGGRDDENEFEFEQGFGDFGHFEETFNQEITRQIDAQVEAMTRQINDQIASISAQVGRSGISPEKSEEIMRRARENSERATARAQDRMRKAQERLAQKMENVRRRTEERTQAQEKRHQARQREGRGPWGGGWPTPPIPPVPPKEPVSEDERLMILRMLEQKKITIDEAEQLLSALEGE